MDKPQTYEELKEQVFRLKKRLLIQETRTLESNERKKKYIALEDDEKRFRELIEEVSEISIQGYNENRQVTFWNLASQKLYGYTEKEALGNTLEDLIIPESMGEAVVEFHRQWVENGVKIPAGELMLRHKTGKDVPVFSSHVMLDTRAGKEMFCIDVDLTPIKESEKEKEKLRLISFEFRMDGSKYIYIFKIDKLSEGYF